jgi:hypothetical protein
MDKLNLTIPNGSKVVVKEGVERFSRFSGIVGTVRDVDIEIRDRPAGLKFKDHVKVVFVIKSKSTKLSTTKGGTVEVTMSPDQLELWVRSRPAKRQRVR